MQKYICILKGGHCPNPEGVMAENEIDAIKKTCVYRAGDDVYRVYVRDTSYVVRSGIFNFF